MAPGALRAQRTQVAERIARLQQLSAGLDRMIDTHERGLLLTIEQQAAILGHQWNPDWPAQARQRYGGAGIRRPCAATVAPDRSQARRTRRAHRRRAKIA
jgi:hypothetical protein